MTSHLITLCLATSAALFVGACVTDPDPPEGAAPRAEADTDERAPGQDTDDAIAKDDINRTRTSRSACPVDTSWCCDGFHNLIECDAFYCYYTGYYCGTW